MYRTMNDFVIEEVSDLDAVWPELRELFLELLAYHEPWQSRRLRGDWEQRWRDYVTLGDDRLILIARVGDNAVAYLNAGVRRDYGIFEELTGFIDDAFVRADVRHRGIGSAMLSRAEDWFRARGATEARLQAVAANDLGVRFWSNAGFIVDNYRMSKPLVEPEA